MEILTWFKSLLVDYGTANVIIMLLIIILTNIIKKPILNKADDFVDLASKYDVKVDKSVITSNIIYIPFALGLVFYTIYPLLMNGFKFAQLSWSDIVSNATIYGALSQSIYEMGKAKLKAWVNRNSYKEAKKLIADADNSKTTGDNDLLEEK